MNKKTFAISELVFASVIWGFGFTATIWAFQGLSPSAINATRFSISFAIGTLLSLTVPAWRPSYNLTQFKYAFFPGTLLCTVILLQTWGLKFTTATNSGFITSLYVVWVPLLEVLFFKRRLHRYHVLFVTIGLLGMAFITNSRLTGLNFSDVNFGDLVTFFCSIIAAVQIIWIDRLRSKITSTFVFNVQQCFWATLLSVVFMMVMPAPHFYFEKMQLPGWIGIFSLTIGSTLLAFFLQVHAQKTLSSTLSSMLFLLEAPFAFLFALLLLGEHMSLVQFIGSLLIFVAAVGASKFER